MFIYDEELGLYREYIVKEGRAKNYEFGLNHICFNVDNVKSLNSIHKYLTTNQLAFRLTFPEKSGSEECNYIVFYKHKDFGIIEFNILSYEDS